MGWLTNEALFYGGIAITVGSAVIAVVHLVASKFKALRLNEQLAVEYGEADQ